MVEKEKEQIWANNTSRQILANPMPAYIQGTAPQVSIICLFR